MNATLRRESRPSAPWEEGQSNQSKVVYCGPPEEGDEQHAAAMGLEPTRGEYVTKNTGIIHLTSRQKNLLPFAHPVLGDRSAELTEEEVGPLVNRHLAGDKSATDVLVMGNLVLVKWLVGRYLYHWPESWRFEEDMCSEGITAVVQGIGEIDGPVGGGAIRAVLVVKIKKAIEEYLNDFRSPVYASLSTNYRRIRDGREPEYNYTESLGAERQCDEGRSVSSGNTRDVGVYDDTPAYIDVLDSLEHLKAIDSEEMVDLILLAIERQHNLLETDLTDDDRKLIACLSSIAA